MLDFLNCLRHIYFDSLPRAQYLFAYFYKIYLRSLSSFHSNHNKLDAKKQNKSIFWTYLEVHSWVGCCVVFSIQLKKIRTKVTIRNICSIEIAFVKSILNESAWQSQILKILFPKYKTTKSHSDYDFINVLSRNPSFLRNLVFL